MLAASAAGTTRPMRVGAISITVTSQPRARALAASSSPMKPPPTMTT